LGILIKLLREIFKKNFENFMGVLTRFKEGLESKKQRIFRNTDKSLQRKA
jgi:hypothetical protein